MFTALRWHPFTCVASVLPLSSVTVSFRFTPLFFFRFSSCGVGVSSTTYSGPPPLVLVTINLSPLLSLTGYSGPVVLVSGFFTGAYGLLLGHSLPLASIVPFSMASVGYVWSAGAVSVLGF